jgi:hypothetical protein
VEGTNCDSFTLKVNGTTADWASKILNVKIDWSIPVNDYDLYIHKGDLTGPIVAQSANGAPSTEEAGVIDPGSSGTGTYTIHVVYFTTTPTDQYVGTASVAARPKGRTAAYQWIKSQFTVNTPVYAPGTTADGEPSSRCDKFGNYYVAGIRGVPAGVDLWYFDLRPSSDNYDPYMRNPVYEGQPDSFTSQNAFSVGADGGGDVDIAVGSDNSGPNNVPVLAFTSLTAANISASRSQDLGGSFTKNPLGSVTGGVPADDRQWLAFDGPTRVYLYYRTLEPAISQIQLSTDGGLTYGPAITAGQLGQAGSIDVDPNDHTVYVSGSSGQVAIGKPNATLGYPTSYTVVQAATDPGGVAALFFVIKVAPDGTVYGTYSNGQHVFLISSIDHGQHWSAPVRVDDGELTRTSLFPALAVGPTKGMVAVAWYGTTDNTNDNNADWRVFAAQTYQALIPTPTFILQQASDHVIHASNISLGGTLGNANRNLLDYFQLNFDPVGAMVIGYTDDHEDLTGNVYVTRQLYGYSAFRAPLPLPREGSQMPPVEPYSTDGSQVLDAPMDVTQGLLVTLPTTDPLDILSIKYSSSKTGNDTLITAAVKVSDMSSVPASSTWRMSFTVNAPYAGLSRNKKFSCAATDRGNQFWIAANTDAQGNKTYTYGTTVRNSDGSLTYTKVGNATSGSFNPVTKTVSVSILASVLNTQLKNLPQIKSGTTLAGLRGSAFTTNGILKEDTTRGGLEYVIP